jgi:hypothetical protein
MRSALGGGGGGAREQSTASAGMREDRRGTATSPDPRGAGCRGGGAGFPREARTRGRKSAGPGSAGDWP